MGDEEAATIDGQFVEFSKLLDNKRTGETITLYRSDYWMRQANVMDDRKVTMTDTGILFNKLSKTELNFDEWLEFLTELCDYKSLELEKVKEALTNCGLPGQTPVAVPQYRTYFDTFKPKDVSYCEPYFDGFLCWGPTPAGKTAFQNCPPARLSDTTREAFRICGSGARWLGRRQNESSTTGWTNYSSCFPPAVKDLFDKVSEDENAQTKFEIALTTRHLEIVGFSISLIALSISFYIFCKYRSLRNDRTRIHMSLFCAMILQVLIRLILYISQEYIRQTVGGDSASYSSTTFGTGMIKFPENFTFTDNVWIFVMCVLTICLLCAYYMLLSVTLNTILRSVLQKQNRMCTASYICLEYAVTVMFTWMFIEGLYINDLVTSTGTVQRMPYRYYIYAGWGLPLIITAFWAVITAYYYRNEEVRTCWYGYNFEQIYWLLQVPRLTVIIFNFAFLLRILRVLVVKLRKNEEEAKKKNGFRSKLNYYKTMKALRATLILLPLLGITNALEMTEGPLDSNVWIFGLWSYCSHFLRSFQGSFIAFIYCFRNTQVQKVIKNRYRNYQAIRETRRRQVSLHRSNGTSADVPARNPTRQSAVDHLNRGMPPRALSWARCVGYRQYSETAICTIPCDQNAVDNVESGMPLQAMSWKRGTGPPRYTETAICSAPSETHRSWTSTFSLPEAKLFKKIVTIEHERVLGSSPPATSTSEPRIAPTVVTIEGPSGSSSPTTTTPEPRTVQTVVNIERPSISSSPVTSTSEPKIAQKVVIIESPSGRTITDVAARDIPIRPLSWAGRSERARYPGTVIGDSITMELCEPSSSPPEERTSQE